MMAGVIDSNGQQWERCNVCCEFVPIQTLLYDGRDICPACVELEPAAQEELSARKSREHALANYERYQEMGWDVTLNSDNSISIHSCGEA